MDIMQLPAQRRNDHILGHGQEAELGSLRKLAQSSEAENNIRRFSLARRAACWTRRLNAQLLVCCPSSSNVKTLVNLGHPALT